MFLLFLVVVVFWCSSFKYNFIHFKNRSKSKIVKKKGKKRSVVVWNGRKQNLTGWENEDSCWVSHSDCCAHRFIQLELNTSLTLWQFSVFCFFFTSVAIRGTAVKVHLAQKTIDHDSSLSPPPKNVCKVAGIKSLCCTFFYQEWNIYRTRFITGMTILAVPRLVLIG